MEIQLGFDEMCRLARQISSNDPRWSRVIEFHVDHILVVRSQIYTSYRVFRTYMQYDKQCMYNYIQRLNITSPTHSPRVIPVKSSKSNTSKNGSNSPGGCVCRVSGGYPNRKKGNKGKRNIPWCPDDSAAKSHWMSVPMGEPMVDRVLYLKPSMQVSIPTANGQK